MGDQFTGEPWGFDLILRILDQTISNGIVGLSTVINLFFIALLAISFFFLITNQIVGRDAWPRVIFMKLFLVWFLTFLTSNWWTLVTMIGEDFTRWGIVLGGNHIDLGSFYAPSGLILTCFKVIKLIWGHAINGLSITSPTSWFTFGWYMAATVLLLIAFYKMVQSVIVAILQFKIHAAIALMFIVASVWKGSAFLAAGIFGGIFSNAIRLMVLGFLTSMTTAFFGSTLWPTQPDYLQAATIAAAAWLWVWIYNQADTLAAGIINGGPSADGSSMLSQQALTAGVGAWAATAIARLGPPGSRAMQQGLGGAAGAAPAVAGGAGGLQSLPSPFTGGPGGGGSGGTGALGESGKHQAAALRASAESMERRAERRMDGANARSGGDYESEMFNSTVALGEKAVGYKGLMNEAANYLDGGGAQSLPLSHEGSVKAEAQRAAVISSLGVGDEIRSMTADGKSSRQISEALGGKLSAIDALSTRNNESGEAAFNRVAAVQAYKTAENIPNPSDASFGAWQRNFRQQKTAKERQAETEARQQRAARASAPAMTTPMPGGYPEPARRAPNTLPYLQRYIPPTGPSSAGMRADFSTED